MADKINRTQSCRAAQSKDTWLQDQYTSPDVDDFLANSMQRLRAKSITEGHYAEHHTDYEDMEEYTKIKHLAEETLRHETSFGKMKELSHIALDNMEQVKRFIIRHEDSLPNGKRTNPAIVEKILSDLQSAKHNIESLVEEGPTRVGSYSEIMDELRYLAENRPGMVTDLDDLIWVERSVVKFFETHVQYFSQTDPAVLMKAAKEMRQELHEKRDREKKREELKQKARSDFIEAYCEYHRLVKQGVSSSDAMKRLEPVENDSGVDGNASVHGNQDRDLSRGVEFPKSPTPSTLTPCSDEKFAMFHDVVDLGQPLNPQAEVFTPSKRGGSASFEKLAICDDALSDVEMEDDAGMSTYYGQEEENRGRRSSAVSPERSSETGRMKGLDRIPERSPEKRRIVSTGSRERDRSPTKKVKGTTTRGIAKKVKKGRKGNNSHSSEQISIANVDETVPSPSKVVDSPSKKSPRRKPKRGKAHQELIAMGY